MNQIAGGGGGPCGRFNGKLCSYDDMDGVVTLAAAEGFLSRMPAILDTRSKILMVWLLLISVICAVAVFLYFIYLL